MHLCRPPSSVYAWIYMPCLSSPPTLIFQSLVCMSPNTKRLATERTALWLNQLQQIVRGPHTLNHTHSKSCRTYNTALKPRTLWESLTFLSDAVGSLDQNLAEWVMGLSVECCNWMFPKNETLWWMVHWLGKVKFMPYNHPQMSKNVPDNYQNLSLPAFLQTA